MGRCSSGYDNDAVHCGYEGMHEHQPLHERMHDGRVNSCEATIADYDEYHRNQPAISAYFRGRSR